MTTAAEILAKQQWCFSRVGEIQQKALDARNRWMCEYMDRVCYEILTAAPEKNMNENYQGKFLKTAHGALFFCTGHSKTHNIDQLDLVYVGAIGHPDGAIVHGWVEPGNFLEKRTPFVTEAFVDDKRADIFIDMLLAGDKPNAKALTAMCIAISQRRLRERAAKHEKELLEVADVAAKAVTRALSSERERNSAIDSLNVVRQENRIQRLTIEGLPLDLDAARNPFVINTSAFGNSLTDESSACKAEPVPTPAPKPIEIVRMVSDESGAEFSFKVGGKTITLDIDIE